MRKSKQKETNHRQNIWMWCLWNEWIPPFKLSAVVVHDTDKCCLEERLLSRCEGLYSPLLHCLIGHHMWWIYNVCIRGWSQCVVTAGLRLIWAWWVSHRAETSLLLTLRCYLCKFCWIGQPLLKCYNKSYCTTTTTKHVGAVCT